MKKTAFRLIALLLLVAISLTVLVSCKSDVYIVEMEIENYGVIKMRLLRNNAPKTVDNFVKLAKEDFYDGVPIIRAQEGFVIQCGGESENTIPGEFASNGFFANRISHVEGVISMARASSPDSASCQFFITIGDARGSLDGSYAGFGYIDKDSMAIVHKIAEDMFPYADEKMGFVEDVTKQPLIKDVRIVDSYNLD